MDKTFKDAFEKEARKSPPFREQINSELEMAKFKIKKAVKKSTKKKK